MTATSFRRSTFAIALPLVVSAACAPGGPTLPFPGPERAGVELTEPDIAAIAEILALEDRRRFDSAAIERLAASGSVEVRRRAIVAAGRLGDPAATPILLRALAADRSAAVRADAAFALGELGDTAAAVLSAFRDAVPPSWVPVRPEETTMVLEVLAALGKLGTPAAAEMVTDALLDARPATAPSARRVAGGALLAAWRFGARTPVTRIAPFLHSGDAELRWRAAYALMRSGRAEAVPPLLASLEDPEHRVRAYAARALTASRADSALVRDSALQLLVHALDDEHPHVRINVLGAVASFGDDAPLDAVAARIRDDDANVAIAAAGAAGRLGGRAADPLAAAARDAGLPMAVRGAALAALGPLDPDRAWAIVEPWTTGEPGTRWLAARALATVGWARGDEALRRLARDEDVRVTVAALESIGALAAGGTLPSADSAALVGRLEALPDVADAAGGLASPAERAASDPDFYHDVARRYVAAPLAGRDRPRAVIRTTAGAIEVELLSEEAPLTVDNFVALAESGYFDGGVWHRVVPNFVLQDGAPAGYADGGPGWAIRDEINRVRYDRGAMGMALSGPDTGGSQWFITHSPQPHLDGGYTVFGRVTSGMDVADRVVQGEPISSIRIRW